LTALAAQIRRVGPLLPRPFTIFEELVRLAARGEVDPAHVDRARAAAGALAADLRCLADLHDQASEQCERLIDAAAAARKTLQGKVP
jgi:hypothetical protein